MVKKVSTNTVLEMRQLVLELSKKAGVGHIASCLSVIEILVALYEQVMFLPSPTHPDRDRFILSKGHAALALYAVLHWKGFITRKQLDTFHQNDSQLGVHPEFGVPGVEVATGSLGHGLSTAAGIALAARLQHKKYRSFVLLSDAECNEGSIWEAVMFAAHHQLHNLIAIVDLNGQQGFGYTQDVLSLSSLADKWRAFGWEVKEVNGHQVPALVRALKRKKNSTKPLVVIAKTVAGKKVSFMEGKVAWHYLPMSDEQYAQAMKEISKDAP